MKQITGTTGRVALVNLTDRKISTMQIPEEYRYDYLGGKGLALKFFYEMRGDRLAEMDPLGEENLLCFFSGVMGGTGGVCSARFAGLTLSPQTGLMVSASCGGPFGIALKTTGYDGLIISGRADTPVRIVLGDPEEAPGEVLDAAELWGLMTDETRKRVENGGETGRPGGGQGGRQNGSLVIGPAGEHLVRYANIASGHRFLGRGGMGAVMGSKNLKAVFAPGGIYRIQPFDKERFNRVRKRSTNYINRNSFTRAYRSFGTAYGVRPGMEAGYLPVHNFRDRTDPRAEVFSGQAMAERYDTKASTCRPCTIQCGHKGTYPDGRVRQIPEYETVGLLGPNLEIWDPDAVAEWNEAANRLGLDTVSLGGTLSWAMEAAEQGLRSSALAFGKKENLPAMIENIALRRGEGDELAEGSRRLAERYGGEDFAVQVKGLELAAYDPRAAWGHGLNYAVANRGGCHLNAYPIGLEVLFGYLKPYSTRSKAQWVSYLEEVFSAINSLQTCLFTSFAYGFEPFIAKYTPAPILSFAMTWMPRLSRLGLDWSVYSDTYRSITGIPMSQGRMLKCGRRIHVLERYMNTLRGVSVEDDRLPGRFTTEAKTAHPVESTVPIRRLVGEYYREKRYDRRGIPPRSLLRSLGINPVPKESRGLAGFSKPAGISAAVSGTGVKQKKLRTRHVPSRRRYPEQIYCTLLLWFLGRAAAAASRWDEEVGREFESMPEGFSFALEVGHGGPAMVLGRDRNGRGVYLGGAGYLRDQEVDLSIRIRTLSAAMLLFTFRESTTTSQARDRMEADGPIPQTCGVVRILNRVESIILPKFIAVRAVKRYRRPQQHGLKIAVVYLGAVFGPSRRRDFSQFEEKGNRSEVSGHLIGTVGGKKK